MAGAGGLASLLGAMLGPDELRSQIGIFRQTISAPVNVNFFCHTPPEPDPAREAAWQQRLAPYYRELGLDPGMPAPSLNRAPFAEAVCMLVDELKPEIVSFGTARSTAM